MPIPGAPRNIADTSLKPPLLCPRQRCIRRARCPVRRQVLLYPGTEGPVSASVSARPAVVIHGAALYEGEGQLRGAGQESIVPRSPDQAPTVLVGQLEAADRAVGRFLLRVSAAYPVVHTVGPDHVPARQHRHRLKRRVRIQIGRDPGGYVEVIPAAWALQVQQYGLKGHRVHAGVDVWRDINKLRGVADDPRLFAGRPLPLYVQLLQVIG